MPSSSYNKQGESRNESARPVTTSLRAAKRNILQVRPPEPGKRGGKPARTVIEAEFLPLLAAAHEFKTPLVVMLGYTDLLQSGELGPLNGKQREVLREMQEGTERLQKVIENLLLLCELRSSNATARESESTYVTDVNTNIKELFNYWRPAAKLKSIRYAFRPAEGVPYVAVEPLRLWHIVSNLIENALNYTPKGGRVAISATSCFWDRRKARTHSLFGAERRVDRKVENAVCISVRDTGPGIAAQYHEDIFGDFVQLSKPSSRGTGLGLAIARRLVESYRGAIWVESEPGKGSEFKVLLSQVS
jgi:signal transduction histidine kinase